MWNEYLWQELINHRHDVMIPVLIIQTQILYFLNKRGRSIENGTYRPSWFTRKLMEWFNARD
jgi:hypothetical protein